MDERIAAWGLAHHGVLSADELAQLGLGSRGVQLRAGGRQLHRIHQTVYALVPPALLRIEGRWLAAVLACGPGAALSHRDAAALHELRRDGRRKIDVTVPGDSHRRHAGIDVHRSRTLRPQDITLVRSIPVTTIARTHLDIAEVVRADQLESVVEQAETLGVLDERALREQIAHNRTRSGAARLKALLDGYQVDFGQVLNAFERDFRAALRAAGMPEPLAGRFVVLDDGGPAIQADLHWPEYRFAIETDGFRFHRSRAAFERNTRNDQRLIDAGWQPMRVTWRQLRDERPRLVSTAMGLLRPRIELFRP